MNSTEETKREIKIKSDYIKYLFISLVVSFFLVFVLEHRGEYSQGYFISPSGNLIKLSTEQFKLATDTNYGGSSYAASLPVYLKATFKDAKYWIGGTLVIYLLAILYLNFKVKITE